MGIIRFAQCHISGCVALTPTQTLIARGQDHFHTAAEAEHTSTIAPYTTALNGVNQPMNLLFRDILWWSLGILGVLVLLIRVLEVLWAKLRQVSTMSITGQEKQEYWKMSQWSCMPMLKKHLIYAPIWNKRHNREIRLSSAINIGTLPSRLHLMVIVFYLASNIIYMFIVDWHVPNRYALCAEIRGRSGTLAIVNMVPLVILAGRNNPLIYLLNLSFDTYNLLHRWMGRIIVVEILIHAISWAIPVVADKGWRSVWVKMGSIFIGSGAFGLLALVLLLALSLSPLRHAFYETFLNTHIILALIVFTCAWIHCATTDVLGGLPQLPWVIATVALWLADRVARFIRLAFATWSRKGSITAFCEAMPGNATRVTLQLPRYVNIKPGTHAYLRFWSINPWENHPFSIAWVSHKGTQLPSSGKESVNTLETTASFIVGAQTGMTRKLYNKALKCTQGVYIQAAMEGPYASHCNLDSYGHVVLFAGSTGITHQLPYVRHLLEGYNAGTVAMRRLTLVWIIPHVDMLEWVRPYQDAILQIPNHTDILRVEVFITRPQSPSEISSTSSSSVVNISAGRPNTQLVLSKEVHEQVGAMCVSVCGPGSLADDVRGAARAVQGDSVVDFVEESFTW